MDTIKKKMFTCKGYYEKNRDLRIKQSLEWQKNNKEKITCYSKFKYFIKKNKIEKPLKCCICNKKYKIHGHHEDYNKPLCVFWICTICHRLIHVGLLNIESYKNLETKYKNNIKKYIKRT